MTAGSWVGPPLLLVAKRIPKTSVPTTPSRGHEAHQAKGAAGRGGVVAAGTTWARPGRRDRPGSIARVRFVGRADDPHAVVGLLCHCHLRSPSISSPGAPPWRPGDLSGPPPRAPACRPRAPGEKQRGDDEAAQREHHALAGSPARGTTRSSRAPVCPSRARRRLLARSAPPAARPPPA